MDQQLQQGLPQRLQIGAGAERRAGPTDPVTQESRAELPELLRGDVSEESPQPRCLLDKHNVETKVPLQVLDLRPGVKTFKFL